MTKYRQSSKLNNVLYDIRGPILEEANRMEALGHRILKLNIGNPAPFGFEAPDAIMMDIIRHLPVTQGFIPILTGCTLRAPPLCSTTRIAGFSTLIPTTYIWATAFRN